LEPTSDVDESKLKTISKILDPVPVFDAPLLQLLRWAADYYHHPIGEVMAAALPKLMREGASLVSQTEYWRATDAGAAALRAGEPKRAPKQRTLLEQLVAAGTSGQDVDTLNHQLAGWRDAAKALAKRDWIVCELRDTFFDSTIGSSAESTTHADPRPELSAQQRTVIDAVGEAGDTGYHAWLLHGVTGSGKTEVYLRLTETQLQHSRRVLVLVPEIGLTPQLVGRFAKRFPQSSLAVLHSGLTDSERLAAWRAAHSGRAQLVIGTRSASSMKSTTPRSNSKRAGSDTRRVISLWCGHMLSMFR
jgi:primosomal protein N' (replication factor Y)